MSLELLQVLSHLRLHLAVLASNGRCLALRVRQLALQPIDARRGAALCACVVVQQVAAVLICHILIVAFIVEIRWLFSGCRLGWDDAAFAARVGSSGGFELECRLSLVLLCTCVGQLDAQTRNLDLLLLRGV